MEDFYFSCIVAGTNYEYDTYEVTSSLMRWYDDAPLSCFPVSVFLRGVYRLFDTIDS